jgi:hypothetical protein
MKTILEERREEHSRITKSLNMATTKQQHFLELSSMWGEEVNEAKFALAFIAQQIEELDMDNLSNKN